MKEDRKELHDARARKRIVTERQFCAACGFAIWNIEHFDAAGVCLSILSEFADEAGRCFDCSQKAAKKRATSV